MPIHYLENRIWFLGAEVLLQNDRKFGNKIMLDKFSECKDSKSKYKGNFPLPKDAHAKVRPASLWTMDNQYPDALVFLLNGETFQAIKEQVKRGYHVNDKKEKKEECGNDKKEEEEWSMSSLRLMIHSSGFLQLLSAFEIFQNGDITHPETITENLQESLDQLYPFLAYLVNQSDTHGLLRKSDELNFGAPFDEQQQNNYEIFGTQFSAFDAFSYNQHFILDTNGDTEANELAKHAGIDTNCMQIGKISLRWGRTVRIWSGNQEEINAGLSTILTEGPIDWEKSESLSENGFVRAFMTDSLQLSKLVLTSTAQTVYAKLLLRMARQEECLKPEQLRSIMDLNNGILQQLSLYEWRLDEEQIKLLECLEEKGRGQDALNGFKSAEADLVASTEGQESLSSRQLSRSTEFILLTLAILGMYSVILDIVTFIGSGGDLQFCPLLSSRSVALIAVTIIVFFYYIWVLQRWASIVARRKRREPHN